MFDRVMNASLIPRLILEVRHLHMNLLGSAYSQNDLVNLQNTTPRSITCVLLVVVYFETFVNPKI